VLTGLYLFALVVGGALLGASILLGGHDDTDLHGGDAGFDKDVDGFFDGGDADAQLDADLSHGDVDLDGDASVDLDGQIDTDVDDPSAATSGAGSLGGLLLIFLSLRFWTFFLAFFGLTGIVLDGLSLAHPMVALACALLMGGGTGFTAVRVLRSLTRDSTTSSARSADYVGKTARVVIPVGEGRTGKVRVQIKGSTVALLAQGVDDELLGGEAEVLIVEMDGPRARVARLDGA
jgi:membrane protein implicated in regulation of membrane protease activity